MTLHHLTCTLSASWAILFSLKDPICMGPFEACKSMSPQTAQGRLAMRRLVTDGVGSRGC